MTLEACAINFNTLWCHQTWQWGIPYYKWEMFHCIHCHVWLPEGNSPSCEPTQWISCANMCKSRKTSHCFCWITRQAAWLQWYDMGALCKQNGQSSCSWFPSLSLWPAWCFLPCVSSSPATKLFNIFQHHLDAMIKVCQTTRCSRLDAFHWFPKISQVPCWLCFIKKKNSWTLRALSSAFSTSISSLGSQLMTILQNLVSSYGIVTATSTIAVQWVIAFRIILSCQRANEPDTICIMYVYMR